MKNKNFLRLPGNPIRSLSVQQIKQTLQRGTLICESLIVKFWTFFLVTFIHCRQTQNYKINYRKMSTSLNMKVASMVDTCESRELRLLENKKNREGGRDRDNTINVGACLVK